MLLRFQAAILVLALLVTTGVLAGHAQASASPAPATTTTVTQPEQATPQGQPSESQSDLAARLEAAEELLVEVKAKLDSVTGTLQIVSVTFAALLSLGTVGSLFGFIRSERRAAEAHSYSLSSGRESDARATAAFDLAITGERASQKRAATVHEEFLTGSKETLELVNATLTLAKEASERAAKTIERRARTLVQELDHDAQFLLASVPSQDDRALIAKTDSRSQLRSLARQIDAFEVNRLILPEDVQLTPQCIFIRGMDFHLNQQYLDAIGNWKMVALSNTAPADLRSLAWYWIGYEQNNLHKFEEAEQSFENALKHSKGSRQYELQRILFETRFFNKARNPAHALIIPLQNLLTVVEAVSRTDEIAARRIKIVVTLANVIYVSGCDAQASGQQETAMDLFKRARDLFSSATQEDKWAAFGLAQTLFKLGSNEEVETAQAIFRDVRKAAIQEAVSREEPRTKVLANTTQLICCLRVPDFNEEVPNIRSLVMQDLGRVDERLTVYSQIQKRNVEQAEFQKDLEVLLESENRTQ